MKAIETTYKGFRFRSRLEARWAIFFDECRIRWEYEPEGFELEDGSKYLPDFKLLEIETYRGQTPIWVEVKGIMTEEDARKIRLFAEGPAYSEKPVNRNDLRHGIRNSTLVVDGTFFNSGIPIYPDDTMFDLYNRFAWGQELPPGWTDGPNSIYPYNLELIDGDFYGGMICIDKDRKPVLISENSAAFKNINAFLTVQALLRARQARFEYDERK